MTSRSITTADSQSTMVIAFSTRSTEF